jgi:S1-C subfamily serine protease
MKWWFALLPLFSFCWPPAGPAAEVDPAVLEAENQRIETMERAKEAVVAVFATTGRGGGSGVVISPDGLALTNYHVTKPCGHWMKCGMADGKVYDAVLVGLDPTGDVALIRLFGRDDFPCATIGDSDTVQPGDWAFAMGNPFLLATNLQPTVTYGIVSGTHRYQYPSGTLLEYADCIQTDAAVNPGNSGGPLFNAEGRLIGINGRCSFEKRGRVSVGVGYAISINQIKKFLGSLKSGRIVDHATLGFRAVFDEDRRVVVDEILESSDAYRRGLRRNDEIVEFAGRPIDSPNALKNAIGTFPKGWRLPLSYRRDGRREDILVRLAGVHSESDLLRKIEGGRRAKIPMPPHPHGKTPPKSRKKSDSKKPAEGKEAKKPKRPHLPTAMPKARPKPPAPEVVKRHYVKKRGYANYFFNELHQQRVWDGWAKTSGDLRGTGRWTIKGTVNQDKKFLIELDDRGARIDLPAGEVRWKASEDVAADLAPPHSGGLLPTLHLWRRLATAGLRRFGDIKYVGTAPLLGDQNRLVDVLAGADGGVSRRYYFDPDEHQLLAIEMFPSEHADPCEVYFDDFRTVDGRVLPKTMEVRFGDEVYGRFTIGDLTFETKPRD